MIFDVKTLLQLDMMLCILYSSYFMFFFFRSISFCFSEASSMHFGKSKKKICAHREGQNLNLKIDKLVILVKPTAIDHRSRQTEVSYHLIPRGVRDYPLAAPTILTTCFNINLCSGSKIMKLILLDF